MMNLLRITELTAVVRHKMMVSLRLSDLEERVSKHMIGDSLSLFNFKYLMMMLMSLSREPGDLIAFRL